MKQWLRNYLGITDVVTNQQQLYAEHAALHSKLNNLQTTINTVVTPGIARIVAKLDAQFTRSEFDKQRKAESDALGDEVIRRLEAEAKARAPYNERDDG